jgi:hypothetical protein
VYLGTTFGRTAKRAKINAGFGPEVRLHPLPGLCSLIVQKRKYSPIIGSAVCLKVFGRGEESGQIWRLVETQAPHQTGPSSAA